MNSATETLGPEQIEVTDRKSQVLSVIRQFATLSQILRFTGASIMVASMSLFLLQGWDAGNDINRYFLLLAQTVLLAAGGFGLSFLLRENKGARVFFGLSLVSIPVNFTILGALIYSQFQWDSGLVTYPDMAFWVMNDVGNMLFTIGAALVVLVPVTFLGLSVMARRSAKKLSVVLLLASSALLLPVRSSLYVGILAAAAALLVLLIVLRISKNDLTLQTPEGGFARMLAFVPSIIILARSILLYQPDAFLIMTIALIAFVTMRQTALQFEAHHWFRSLLEVLSPLAALIVAVSLLDGIESIVYHDLVIPICATAFSALVADIAFRCGRYEKFYSNLAAIVFAGGFLINLQFFGGLLNAGMCLVAGIGILMAGYVIRRRLILVLGVITLLIGLVYQLHEAIQLVDLTSWGSLAIIGTTAIVIASVLDRHGATLKLRATHWLSVATNKSRDMA